MKMLCDNHLFNDIKNNVIRTTNNCSFLTFAIKDMGHAHGGTYQYNSPSISTTSRPIIVQCDIESTQAQTIEKKCYLSIHLDVVHVYTYVVGNATLILLYTQI